MCTFLSSKINRTKNLLKLEMMELVKLPGLGRDVELEGHAQKQHEGTR